MIEDYFQAIQARLAKILDEQNESLSLAAKKIHQSLKSGGVIHLYGAGHSHMMGEELFYRAGGLVPINPIFDENTMLHKGAIRSSEFERMNDYAGTFLKKEDIRSTDVLIVTSTSGRNPVPIDVAIYGKEKEAYTIALTSFTYTKSQPSRHSSQKKLKDVVDLAIDNLSPIGDAVLSHKNTGVSFAPSSSVIGMTILNGVFAQAIALMAERGESPPIFLSGNLEGSDDHNARLIDKYKRRITKLG
ncbi:SIS domain-containing protein [Alteribacter aurantiacus]|uniref:SIS domain-containing protein n=1 Tax=Alteribacter aurantiacus TaxID=254410 RepID=UPI0004015F50|nr:SIS domain-containing protein [Alteribacter aurantiacus]